MKFSWYFGGTENMEHDKKNGNAKKWLDRREFIHLRGILAIIPFILICVIVTAKKTETKYFECRTWHVERSSQPLNLSFRIFYTSIFGMQTATHSMEPPSQKKERRVKLLKHMFSGWVSSDMQSREREKTLKNRSLSALLSIAYIWCGNFLQLPYVNG